MALSIQEARAMFTKNLIDVMQERIRPTGFLRSFFPSAGKPVSKLISIEVERGFEMVSRDVVRGSEGRRNRFSLSTEKIFQPPIYREYFDATELDLYDRVLGSTGDLNAPLFAALLNSVADKLSRLQDKIERSEELQCAQVVFTGVVQLINGTDIDFLRKAASLVDLVGAGGYWSTGATDVFQQLADGCKFLRTVGKSSDATYNCIMAENVYAALLKNDTFKTRQNFFSMKLDAVAPPQRNSTGAAYQGRVTAGAYNVDLWTYPQFYDDPTSADPSNPTMLPYIPDSYFTLLPATPRFHMAHGLVPQLATPGQVVQQQEWVYGNFRDERNAADIFDVQTAPLAIPVAVDQLYTAKALA